MPKKTTTKYVTRVEYDQKKKRGLVHTSQGDANPFENCDSFIFENAEAVKVDVDKVLAEYDGDGTATLLNGFMSVIMEND